ncbi:helicase associated domain-containing protein [Glutamicibacter sp. NPDC087831]|uniref:helicase associated domain-containing protein n=1 Tax=Glutamicibacter sp. NPDC087831 TaxID=3363998 RepID=UPI00380E42D3
MNRPSTAWRRRANEAIAFQTEHGRLPGSSGGPAERSLYTWIAEQRRLFEKGLLPASKVFLLEAIEGWEVNLRQREINETWRGNLAAVVEFHVLYGRLPRYRTYLSEPERSIGVWLHNQHQRRSKDKLLSWRLEALNEALPGWRSRR